MSRHVSELLPRTDTPPGEIQALGEFFYHKFYSWLPIAACAALLILFSYLNLQIKSELSWLLPAVNTIFLTCLPIMIAILCARGFLEDRSPVLLLFGCGMLIISIGGPFAGLLTIKVDSNNGMQIYNLSVLLVSLCNFAAALQLFVDPDRLLKAKKTWLIGGYCLSAAAAIAIVWLSTHDQIPVFFISGTGSTSTRHLVLNFAICIFFCSSALLFIRHLQSRSQFLLWYSLGMLLFAIGLSGTYAIRYTGTPQNWAARICFYTAGVYLFIAAISAARQGRRWSIPLNILRETHWRYEQLMSYCPDGICVHVDGRFVFANPAFAAILGHRSPDELINQPVMNYIHPASQQAIKNRITQVLSQQKPVQLADVQMLRTDGTIANVETVAVNVKYDGRPAILVVVRDIAERKRAEDARRAIEQRYKSLFEGMTEGFALHEIILDDKGVPVDYRFLDVNPSFERFTGLRREDVVGKTKRQVLPDDDENWIELYGHVALTGEPMHFEQRSSALNRYYEVMAFRPAPMQFAVLFLDVSDRKIMEIELRRAKDAAERASRAKDEFLATLSHELRTPLTPVLLTASLLERRNDLPDDLREDITTIRRNVLLEARLIDDLLDLTRIAKGKIQFEFQQIDAHTIARSATEICASGDGARIELILNAKNTCVQADPARLQQVIWNLLNNARKFTPLQGAITLITSNPQPDILRLQVTDTGCGIEQAFLPRVFNAFEQGQSSGKRPAGLGLGLAIAKAIMDAHNGNISVASEGLGKGTTFSVELRCVNQSVMNEQQNHPAPAAFAPTGSLKLLLVEDHDSTRIVMIKLLKTLGHQVMAAYDVKNALEVASRESFDLVISDIGLPDGSGHDLMSILRTKYKLRGIALSGYGMEEDKQRSMHSGFVAHLTKPVSIEQLQAVLREVMTPAA